MSYYSHSRNQIKVELYLSNYGKKSEVEKATGFDVPQFANFTELA